MLISYLTEHDDAEHIARWVGEAGRKAAPVPGDLADPACCRAVIAKAVEEFGRVDILVSNAAFQMTHEDPGEISDEKWDDTLAFNLSAMFHLCKAAIPHMRPGSSIIGTSSVNSDNPTPQLLPYDVTKAGIANFTAGLPGLLARASGPTASPRSPSGLR